MTFSEKVQFLLKRKGWKQQDLVNAIGGITASSISGWMRGATPAMDAAFRTARALDVPLDYLADDSLDEPPAVMPDASALSLEQQMVLKAMETVGFEETWRRLMQPTPERMAELEAALERAYPRDDPPKP